MTTTLLLTDGIQMGESPRWHEGRLWLSDWLAGEVLAVQPDGRRTVMVRVPTMPFSFDWLSDGTFLVVAGQALLRQDPNGTLVTHADLSSLSPFGGNEIVVDAEDRVYVNNIGFDLMSGEEPRPGLVGLVTPDGAVTQVAGDLLFPNGMAIAPDGITLLVAESYGHRLTAFDIEEDGSLSNRRTWADLGEAAAPDGICVDADGAVWYADVPNRHCVRVAEGGEVLQTVEADRGCFACMLGGPDGTTLHIVANQWAGLDEGASSGVVLTASAPAPAAGWPASTG